MNLKHVLSIITLSLLLVISCKKDSMPEDSLDMAETAISVQDLALDLENRPYRSAEVESFFKFLSGGDSLLSSRTSTLESQVANQILYELDAVEPFVEDWIADYGLPCWECGTSDDFGDRFNVSIPFYENGELTAIVAFLSFDNQGVRIHVRSKVFNQAMSPYENGFTTNFFGQIFSSFEDLDTSYLDDSGVGDRGDCSQCPVLYVPTWATLHGNQWFYSLDAPGSFCICYDWNSGTAANGIIDNTCCLGNNTLNYLDGGVAEAGSQIFDHSNFPTWNDWFYYYTLWLEWYANQTGGTTGGGTGGSAPPNNATNNVKLLSMSRNEQKVLSDLIEQLEGFYNGEAPAELVHALANNPHISSILFLYLNGYYGETEVSVQTFVDFAQLLADHEPLSFDNLETEMILTFEPGLISDIDDFLNNHPNDPMAEQVVHDLLAAQTCDTQNPCVHTDYPNDFEKIYDFYQGLTEEEYDWLTEQGQDDLRGLINEMLLDPNVSVSSFSQQYKLVFGELIPELGLDPVEDGLYLLENNTIATEVGDYLENHGLEYQESANESVKLYLDILRNSDLEGFNTEFAAIPSFIWPFVREVGLELAIELFKRNFPGADLPNSLLDAVNALAQGDLLTLGGEIIDIVKIAAKNAGLPLKVINLVWDGVDLGVEASKAWKAFSKMEQFGGEVVDKFFQVFKNHAGSILNKLKWKKGAGVEMTGINDPEQFWDDLENLFPSATILSLNDLAEYEVAGFTINGTGSGIIRFSIKFGGGTNPDGYTLEIKLGNSPPIKFRFF